MSIPASGGGDITVATEAGEGSLRVPASGEAKTAIDGTKVFNGTAKDSAVAIQTTNGGVRVALDIKSADAPESYDFVFGGDISKLTLNADGSVTAGNKGGEPTGEIAAPWAYDANGKPVPTHYKIDGTTLTQVIEHKAGNYVYEITADPSWWWAAKCGTQIGIFLLENAAAPGKIVKILKAGATTFSKLLKSKGSKAKAIKWLAYEESGAKGIATVVEKCWP